MTRARHRYATPVPLALLFVLGFASCATDRPIAPLVPLPEHLLPSRAELAYRPWRVVVGGSGLQHADVERAFVAELKGQLSRYGIHHISSDAATKRLLDQMLQLQVQSGGEVNVKDLQYEMSQADGVLSVTVNAVTMPRSNTATRWYDKKKKKNRHIYTSEVVVAGYCTLAIPKTGNATTVQFSENQIMMTYDQSHHFPAHDMALKAARQAARSSRVMNPIHTRFPLTGYVIGTGDKPKLVRINRGSDHGVRRGRKWELIMAVSEQNVLLGELVSEQVVGTARTVEVYADSCLAKCDSARTRERAKLGMRVRSGAFGFSLADLFAVE